MFVSHQVKVKSKWGLAMKMNELKMSMFLTAGMLLAGPAFAASSYVVPTDEAPELAEFAQFKLPVVRANLKRDGRMRLHYRLPSELVGAEAKRFSLQGKLDPSGAPTALSHNGISSECQMGKVEDGEADLTCQVTYHELQVDKTAAMEYVRTV
jgi:hypothetical protein